MLEKLKNKMNAKNMPIILFIVVIVNLLPLAVKNIISAKPASASTLMMGTAFAIEAILLAIVYFREIKITKEFKINIGILCFILVSLSIVQIVNFFYGNIVLNDVMNIAIKIVTIFLLFCCVIDLKTDEENIFKVMKLFLYTMLIACLYSLGYFIIRKVFFHTGSYINIRSFFGNRNQFAFSLLLAIIANTFMIEKQFKKRYIVTLIIFIINILLTCSRTAIIAMVLFEFLYFLLISNFTKKWKIEIILLALILANIIFILLVLIVPQKIENVLMNLVRVESIATFSGRTNIWKIGIEKWTTNPLTVTLGTGRFKAVNELVVQNKKFSHFHNIIIETLVSGGIVELAYIIYIYATVLRKLLKSNIQLKYKKLYIIAFICYIISMCMESYGRFSLGYQDTICIVFFVTIPILFANTFSDKQK